MFGGGKCPEVEPQNHVVIFFLIFEEIITLILFTVNLLFSQSHLEKFLGKTLRQKQAKWESRQSFWDCTFEPKARAGSGTRQQEQRSLGTVAFFERGSCPRRS